jgi:hypothetical protein
MALLHSPTDIRIDSGDSFFIENHSTDKTLEFQWNRLVYKIAPGMKKIVPFDVVALFFGDPRSIAGRSVPYRDSRGPGMVPDRRVEVMRLSVRYGVYEQGAADIRAAIIEENRRLAMLNEQSFRPVTALRDENFYARVTTLEGDEVIPPLFDHEGKHTYGFSVDNQKSDDIAVLMRDYESRLKALEKTKEVVDESGDNTDEGIPIDNPGDPVGEVVRG